MNAHRTDIDKDVVISTLSAFKSKFSRSYGLKRIGLFGSTANSRSRPGSDVDVVVDLERQDLFFLIGIKQELEESLGAHVDVVSYRQTMNPYLKRRIDAEAIYV